MNISSTGFVSVHEPAGTDSIASECFCQRFVSGHDFSRAENEPFEHRALAPAESLRTML
jgi:hypothetical protein